MKRAALIVFVIICCSSGAIAFAENSGNAENSSSNRYSVFAGYNGEFLNYWEYDGSDVLDRDLGWLDGFFIQGRFNADKIFAKIDFNYVQSKNARYDGQDQSGNVIFMATSERIYNIRGEAGYRLFSIDSFSIFPVLGIGYRYWIRGEDSGGDYSEDYSWWFVSPGLYLQWVKDNVTIGFEAVLLKPYGQKMVTGMAGTYDTATFKIKSEIGYRLELPLTWKIYSTNRSDFYLTETVYYERWNIGASPVIQMTQNGAPTGDYYSEPSSHTDVYGLRIGAGLSF